MRFRIVDLNGVVKQMHPMLRRLIGEDITLAVDMDAAPTLATVDPNQIEQVILNLAVNARDAMPRGGQITISTRNAPAAGTANGARVRLTVSDTGMGIPPEILEKIFEPFFSTKGEKGTGLGLATVYGIIQQSGGDIRVQTAPEKGTAFEIDLPAAAMQAAAAEPEAPAAPPVGSGVILLVEDEDPVRAVTANILRSRGFQVVECRNAGEALLICERSDQPIDLMLTDIVMPLMSGPQLAERITALRPALRILYMSGYTDDATSRHGMHGGIDFIEKPFTADSLVSKIVSVLG